MDSQCRRVSVIGLGYVGLPLLSAFAGQTEAVGFDDDAERVAQLRQGRDDSGSISPEALARIKDRITADPEQLRHADFHLVAVPTPINRMRQPDLGCLLRASETLAGRLKRGDIVVYESTVYPGVTEEECIPVLERGSGLRCGADFFVGYSPERINPGDPCHTLENTVKIIAAPDAATLEQMADLYGRVIRADLYRVQDIRVAEAAKVIENIQRDLNIALMNEFSFIFNAMGIDTHEVLAAAGTKWNFLSDFTPGLVGGHCVGVDPYYLLYKAAESGYHSQVILAGRNINDSMGTEVAHRLLREMSVQGQQICGSRITVLGFAFKPDIPDVRNTRVADMVRELKSFGALVQLHDPLADAGAVRREYGLELLPRQQLQPAGAVVLAVPHHAFVQAGWELPQTLLEGGKGVVFDVKSKLERSRTPAGVSLLRL